ncbi:hypothetical protein ABK040_002214 [Willaertia magna]
MLLFLFGCIHYFILQNLYKQQFLQQQQSTNIITDRNVNLEEEEGQQLINVIDSGNDNIFHTSSTYMEKLLSIEKLNSFKWLMLVLSIGDFIHLGVVMLYVSNWSNYWFIFIPISLSLSLALMRVCYLMFYYFGELLIHFVKNKNLFSNLFKKEKVHDFQVDELTAQ